MLVFKNDMNFYCDVDDTLIMWAKNGHTWTAHNPHIELLKRAKVRGQMVIVWSAGGGEWAAKACKMLGIEEYVDICIRKPMWWVDDLSANEILIKHNRIYLENNSLQNNSDDNNLKSSNLDLTIKGETNNGDSKSK